MSLEVVVICKIVREIEGVLTTKKGSARKRDVRGRKRCDRAVHLLRPQK
jgi:hypothetical protein